MSGCSRLNKEFHSVDTAVKAAKAEGYALKAHIRNDLIGLIQLMTRRIRGISTIAQVTIQPKDNRMNSIIKMG